MVIVVVFSFLAIAGYLSPRISLNPIGTHFRFVNFLHRAVSLTFYYIKVRLSGRAFRIFVQKAYTIVGALADSRVKRNGSKEFDADFFSQPFRSAGGRFEYLTFGLTPRTHKPGHVLDETQDGDTDFPAKVDLLPNVLERDLLWGRDEHGAIDSDGIFQILDDAEMFIRRTRWSVHQHPIQISPIDVPKELGDNTVLLGPAPDDGGGLGREEETD